MEVHSILAAIDAEIARLQEASSLLGAPHKASRRTAKRAAKKALGVKTRKRTLSPEARARIAAAQRKRWAAAKSDDQIT